MISVLIPIFNFDVTALVNEVYRQLKVENILFEFIIVDDASTSYVAENSKLASIPNITFTRLKENIGRSKIRNLLADNAKFDWLLFLDVDVFPETDKFIKNYIHQIKKSKFQVFCGGIIYGDTSQKIKRTLRYVYGKSREEVSFEVRDKSSFQYFLGANFLINKSIFKLIRFNEDIINYGYEDTLFVNELRVEKIEIRHIENRVFHNGIDGNKEFVLKTRMALENLQSLYVNKMIDRRSVKLLKAYEMVNGFGVTNFLSKGFTKFKDVLEKNLLGKKPSLLIFDIYKLGYFCYLSNIEKES